MTDHTPPRPVAPVCPEASACCDSGCDPCIFDFYREELEDYRKALSEWESLYGQSPTSSATVLGQEQ